MLDLGGGGTQLFFWNPQWDFRWFRICSRYTQEKSWVACATALEPPFSFAIVGVSLLSPARWEAVAVAKKEMRPGGDEVVKRCSFSPAA